MPQIRPPSPPPLPDRLPFENTIDRALDRLAGRVSASPALKRLQDLHARLPSVPEVEVPTPMGRIKTPQLALPRPVVPEMDDRRKDALKAAILDDVASLIGLIPVVGDILSDVLEDVAMAKVHDTLTPAEYEQFKLKDKFWPLTALSMIDALSR